MIIGREGEQKLPINDKSVSRKHLEASKLANGRYLIRNLGKNGTFVNGLRVEECEVDADTKLQLGTGFTSTLRSLITGQLPPQAVNISHLKGVMERYQKEKAALQRSQMSGGFYRLLGGIALAFCGVLGYVMRISPDLTKVFAVVMVLLLIVAVGLFIYASVYQKRLLRELPEKQIRLLDRFKLNYVCPKCKKWLGDLPFEAIKRQEKCPYCGTPWEE